MSGWSDETVRKVAAVCFGIFFLIHIAENYEMYGQFAEAMFTTTWSGAIAFSIIIIFLLYSIIQYVIHGDRYQKNSADYSGDLGTQTSNSGCSKCGNYMMSKNKGIKTTKVAIYTPAGSWVGATIGMALGGLPGLFLGGLFGGAGGIAKATEEKDVCIDCKYK